MRTYPFLFAAIISLGVAFPTRAAEKPQPAQTGQTQPKKIWTNDDMDDLRTRGLISIVGPDVQQVAAPSVFAPPSQQSALPIYHSRLEDPRWYAEQATGLQAELDRRQTLLREQQQALVLASRGITQPGVALDKASYGISPQDAVANLEAQVNEVRSQLYELSDLARRNDIPPGVVRG